MSEKSADCVKRVTFYSQMKLNQELTYKNLVYLSEYVDVLEKALELSQPIDNRTPVPLSPEPTPVIAEMATSARLNREKLEGLSSRVSRIVTELTQG